MAETKKTYDEDDAVCIDCIEDDALRELVRSEGKKQVCVECGEKNTAVSIKDLAAFIDPYMREHYRPGPYERRYGPGDDDSYREEQQGEDLSYVVQDVIGQYFEFNDALVDALIDNDPADIGDGGEPFYASDINYVQTRVYVGHLYDEWRAISSELKTERRFFSDRARKFFDWLFAGIEDLWFYEPKDDPDFTPLSERKKLGVIQEWSTGTVLYRTRRADTREDYTRLVLKPAVELAPPPSKYARAGRMNAEGVTIFYGALDAETCLAEMRSSIGGYTVLGRFETTKPLRVLDFSRLDKAYWDGKPLSYFQSDFDEQVTRRKFRRRLHKLISEPVIPGHEDKYLITQVLAEYLAYVRNPNFDGLLFASTQYESGTNVVLFPKHNDIALENESESGSTLGRFPLKYVDDSVEIYRTKGIKYDVPKVDHFLVDDKVHLHNRDYDEDDDD
jgi:hypothetical protein